MAGAAGDPQRMLELCHAASHPDRDTERSDLGMYVGVDSVLIYVVAFLGTLQIRPRHIDCNRARSRDANGIPTYGPNATGRSCILLGLGIRIGSGLWIQL